MDKGKEIVMKKREIEKIKKLVADGKLWDKVVIDELGKRIAGEIKAREIIFLCAMGRLVINCEPSSFNLLVHSESSAGKDYVVKNVLKLFPKNKIVSRTRISEKVLNYWKPYKEDSSLGWNTLVLYLPDVSDAILNCEALKLMCSEGSHITITENTKSGKEAVDVEILGKPVVITTTAKSMVTSETANRFSVVKLDESEKQTKAIMQMQSRIAELGAPENYGENIKDFLIYLKRCSVKIPFAHKIVKIFPAHLLRDRRNFNRFIDFIRASAVFHQSNRINHRDLSISAELKDYDIAKNIFENLYSGVGEIPLNLRQKGIIKVLENSLDGLTAAEIQPQVKPRLSMPHIRPYLNALVSLGIIDAFVGKDTWGREITKYKLSPEYQDFKPIKLPNSDEL